ncbi:unnamed protein product [Protopolystoma xenopodis]|uniref:non-specific serine/threonine protein kinase n=1 Tax=Protopolystoma xenopodis TaxID=117903 RepID=A0A448W9T0_9PLAT|nr:unnamed protein product [Protopolystoma xenopodis]
MKAQSEEAKNRSLDSGKLLTGSLVEIQPPGSLFKQGAEARIYLANLFPASTSRGDGQASSNRPPYGPRLCIVKERFVKTYRHPQLDAELTRGRLRTEARLLLAARQIGLDVPPVLHVDLHRRQLWLGHVGEGSLTVAELLLGQLNRLIRKTHPVVIAAVGSAVEMTGQASSTGKTTGQGETEDVSTSLAREPNSETLNMAANEPDSSWTEAVSRVDRLMCSLATAIGRMLARLHANNLVHGDLTLANILVRKVNISSQFKV